MIFTFISKKMTRLWGHSGNMLPQLSARRQLGQVQFQHKLSEETKQTKMCLNFFSASNAAAADVDVAAAAAPADVYVAAAVDVVVVAAVDDVGENVAAASEVESCSKN